MNRFFALLLYIFASGCSGSNYYSYCFSDGEFSGAEAFRVSKDLSVVAVSGGNVKTDVISFENGRYIVYPVPYIVFDDGGWLQARPNWSLEGFSFSDRNRVIYNDNDNSTARFDLDSDGAPRLIEFSNHKIFRSDQVARCN